MRIKSQRRWTKICPRRLGYYTGLISSIAHLTYVQLGDPLRDGSDPLSRNLGLKRIKKVGLLHKNMLSLSANAGRLTRGAAVEA